MGQRKTMLVGTAGAAEKILFDCRDAGTASEDSLREGFLEAIEGNFHDEGAARCRLGSSSGVVGATVVKAEGESSNDAAKTAA